MIIDGQDAFAKEKFEDRSPANTDILLESSRKAEARRRSWRSRQPARLLANGAERNTRNGLAWCERRPPSWTGGSTRWRQ